MARRSHWAIILFGTSGGATLIKSAKPSLTNVQIYNAMTSTALDIRDVGINRDSGYRPVMAPASSLYSVFASPPNSSSSEFKFSCPFFSTRSPEIVAFGRTNRLQLERKDKYSALKLKTETLLIYTMIDLTKSEFKASNRADEAQKSGFSSHDNPNQPQSVIDYRHFYRYNPKRNLPMATAAQAPLFAMQQFFEIVTKSVHVFGTSQAAVEWFETANTALNDKTPFEDIVKNGPKTVEMLIGRIEHGVYS